jgi:tetratricopeptide (TPR) repeat protein
LRNFALRGGWHAYGWSTGVGGNYYGVYLDYALSSETLGLSHRFSLTYRWGLSLAEQAKIRAQRLEAETDQRAQVIAQREMQKSKTAMESLIKAQVVRHAKEKRKIIETSRQLIQKQVLNQKRAVANEYFKALHYFRGIEDYMKKNYREARVEFETVAKYDPNYMQLRFYLARVKSMLDPSVQLLNNENSNYYYQGMDYYVQNNFEAAIEEWKKILVTQPNSVLALRNIEEAQERLVRIKEFENEANQSKD